MGHVSIKGITRSFGEKQVLRGVTFDLHEGEILCVIGKSGTGKSVILKHLLGFLEPDDGEIFVDDIRSDHVSRETRTALRGKFGILFQGAALFDSMSVYDNIAFGPRRSGMDEEAVRVRVTPFIEKLALAGYESRLPSEISGGLQKRVGLCRALAMHPEIMLYDEPTTGVDPITGAAVDRMIVDMRKAFGITSLVITHDMQAVKRIADRVAMLHEGRIIFEGSKDELFASDDSVIRHFVEGKSDESIRS
ncbi:MAG TPA: ATP-binding cassette domain-containing protein [Spirochaetota bacterium]